MNRLVEALKRLSGQLVGEGIRWFARILTGVRPVWRGALPRPAARIYFANHSSHGDFVLVWTTLPGAVRRSTRPVAAVDYWTASSLRRFIGSRVFNALLIDRQHTGQGPSPVEQMVDALQRGESLILFPEGTRNTSEAPLLPFKAGLHHIGLRCPGVELVPVWIDNVRRVIPKGQWLPVPMVCSVSFGEPLAVSPDEDRQAFLQRAESAVLALQPPESASA